MTKVSLNPRYIPLIQKPNCCAVTCLQMILYRNGCGLFDQEDLAVYFGVKIEEDDARIFTAKLDIMTSANLDEGISTLDSCDAVNAFFETHKLRLTCRARKSSTITDLGEFLEEHLRLGHDIWMEYHGDAIHADDGYRDYQGRYLHDSLVEAYNPATEMATIVDPMPEHRQRFELSLQELHEAVSSKYGKETGFLIVQKPAA